MIDLLLATKLIPHLPQSVVSVRQLYFCTIITQLPYSKRPPQAHKKYTNKSTVLRRNIAMTVVIEPVYLQLFMLPITCFISPKSFFLVVTMFGEKNELHQHVALGTINLTYRCPMCIFYHAVYIHGVLPCQRKCLTQIRLRWTPAFSAIHGL